MYKPANGAVAYHTRISMGLAYHARISMGSSPGHCSMAPFCSSLVCTPAENLRNYQVLSNVPRTKVKKKRQPLRYLATWNVRSIADIEGLVETVWQGTS